MGFTVLPTLHSLYFALSRHVLIVSFHSAVLSIVSTDNGRESLLSLELIHVLKSLLDL